MEIPPLIRGNRKSAFTRNECRSEERINDDPKSLPKLTTPEKRKAYSAAMREVRLHIDTTKKSLTDSLRTTKGYVNFTSHLLPYTLNDRRSM